MNKTNNFKGISKLNRCELLAIINAAVMLFSEGLEYDDLATLGGLFTAIGDTLSVFASVKQSNEE